MFDRRCSAACCRSESCVLDEYLSGQWLVFVKRFFPVLNFFYLLEQLFFFAARRPYREPVTRHDLGRMEVKCRWCGALHWMGEKISNSLESNPLFGLCCNSGKVVLPTLRDPPGVLKALLEDNDRQAKDFRENIWKYNHAFAFTHCKSPKITQ